MARVSLTFAFLALLGLVGSAAAQPPAGPFLEWRQATDKSLTLVCNGKVLWQFNHAQAEGKPYFHPVNSTDGALLTWLRPADHTWHRGIWFSWKLINQVNYWEEDKQGQAAGSTEITARKITRDGRNVATIELDLTYRPPGKPPVLREKRTIMVTPPDQRGDYRMDWDMTWTAGDGDVTLDRTKPPAQGGPSYGGYAGLTFRAAQDLTDYVVLDSEGRGNRAGHGKPARWMDFSAVSGTTKKPAGVALFDHPGNPRHPTPWFIDSNPDRRYGFMGAAPLFHEPITLKAGQSWSLRYRVLIHNGRPDIKQLQEEWKQFGGEAKAQK